MSQAKDTGEITAESIARWRHVFGNPLGESVLTDLLAELHYFDPAIETDEQRIGINYAHLILARLGAWHPENRASFVGMLMQLPAHHAKEAPDEFEDDDAFEPGE